MEELFTKVLSAKMSSKHYISIDVYCTVRKPIIQAYVHNIVNGYSEGIAESINTIYNSVDDVSEFLDKWIEIISEEAKHDNEGTG